MNIAISTTLENIDFDSAVEKTKAALSEQGFGVLTEIDVQATLQAKLGEQMERYLILGACNPALAHRAVGVMRQIGLLLPCNVVVRDDISSPDSGSVIVEAMNPQIMVEVTDEPALADVAGEATSKLRAAVEALGGRTTTSD
jgi:uncharacterized protein (DUF302 family)